MVQVPSNHEPYRDIRTHARDLEFAGVGSLPVELPFFERLTGALDRTAPTVGLTEIRSALRELASWAVVLANEGGTPRKNGRGVGIP